MKVELENYSNGGETTEPPLLSVRDLTVRLNTADGSFCAADDVAFDLNAGETLALVGESGCGKTMTALAILQLLPPGIARIESGEILLRGRDLVPLTARELLDVRGREVGMIFQDPLSALNPVYTVGEQVAEGLRRHEHLTRQKAWERAIELFARVGIPAPAQRARDYPHQLSGGMRQRVMIAIAIACNPSLLIADEPTTALDVSVQAQILDLLLALQREGHPSAAAQGKGMALLLITHDLGIVAEMAQRVAVMYAGQIVETGDVRPFFRAPLHPYSRALLNSVPKLTGEAHRLETIEGTVPDLRTVNAACRFLPRCRYAQERCHLRQELRRIDGERAARCCRAEEWMTT